MLKSLFVALAATLTLALPATDAFTGANNDPLSGNWTGTVGGFQIISNKASGTNGGGFSISRWTGDSFTDDQYAQAVLNQDSANASGPAVRADASGNGYVVSCFGFGANNCSIQDISSNGTVNTGLSGCAANWSASVGDTIKLSAVSTTISAYVNGSGTPIDSCTNSAYSTGRPGVFAYLTGSLDDFQADNIGGGGGPASFVPAIINAPIRGGGVRSYVQ